MEARGQGDSFGDNWALIAITVDGPASAVLAGLDVHSGDIPDGCSGRWPTRHVGMELAQKQAVPVPWQEVSKMDARREFVRLAGLEEANRRELCRRLGICLEHSIVMAGLDQAEPGVRPSGPQAGTRRN